MSLVSFLSMCLSCSYRSCTEQSELRRIDPQSGEVLEQRDMPAGIAVSGRESNGSDTFFCGGGNSGKVRAVRRPR